jgi:protein TonB
MEKVRSLQNFSTRLENNNSFPLYMFVLTCAFHAVALFYTNLISIPSPIINFSHNASDQVLVKVKFSAPIHKTVTPKMVVKPKGTQKIEKKKMVTDKVQQKQAAIETREITKNLGTNSLKALYLSNLRKLINKNKVYPKTAKRLKHQGRLKIELIIDKNGNIISKKFLNKSPSIFLNESASNIFKTLTNFGKLPASIAHKPLKVIVPIVYELI